MIEPVYGEGRRIAGDLWAVYSITNPESSYLSFSPSREVLDSSRKRHRTCGVVFTNSCPSPPIRTGILMNRVLLRFGENARKSLEQHCAPGARCCSTIESSSLVEVTETRAMRSECLAFFGEQFKLKNFFNLRSGVHGNCIKY